MKCPNPACGKEIIDSATFCPYCGMQVRVQQQAEAQPIPQAAANADRTASYVAAASQQPATRVMDASNATPSGSSQKRPSQVPHKSVWKQSKTLFWGNIKGFATASLVSAVLLFLVPVVTVPYFGGISMVDGLLALFRIASIPGVSSFISSYSNLSSLYTAAGVLGLVGIIMVACSIRGCQLAWSGITKGADLGVRVNGIPALLFFLIGMAAGASSLFLLLSLVHVAIWALMMAAYFEEGLHGFKENM